MKPRCGRCGGTYRVGINRLVPFFILKLFRDIGRQRHLSDGVEHVINVALMLEFNNAIAVLDYVNHLGA